MTSHSCRSAAAVNQPANPTLPPKLHRGEHRHTINSGGTPPNASADLTQTIVGCLVTAVMTREPYASARRVFWIVDNGASHRGWTAAARLSQAFPNAIMVHTPVHASWLNQIEIYFSIVQRKLLTPDDFADLDLLAEQLTAFEARYNTAAQPFDWRFSRDDLDQLLDRIAA